MLYLTLSNLTYILGILGVALKPASGVFDLASRAAEGLRYEILIFSTAFILCFFLCSLCTLIGYVTLRVYGKCRHDGKVNFQLSVPSSPWPAATESEK